MIIRRKYKVGDRFRRGPHIAEIVKLGEHGYYVMRFIVDGKTKDNIWSEEGIEKKMIHISTPKPKTYLPEDLFNL